MTDPIRAGGKDPFDQPERWNEAQFELGVVIREEFKQLYNDILGRVPSNRERSLAITKLEEAGHWVAKAIEYSAVGKVESPHKTELVRDTEAGTVSVVVDNVEAAVIRAV